MSKKQTIVTAVSYSLIGIVIVVLVGKLVERVWGKEMINLDSFAPLWVVLPIFAAVAIILMYRYRKG